MLSLKDIMAEQKSGKSQLLADFITRVADNKFGAIFKFVTNFDVIDESGKYTVSLYRDMLSEKALSVNWTTDDKFASISYWSDYASSPCKPDKEAIFEDTDFAKMKPIVEAVFDRLTSCKEDKVLLENTIIKEGINFTELLSSFEDLDVDDNSQAENTSNVNQDEQIKLVTKRPATDSTSKQQVAKAVPTEHWADADTIFDDVKSSIKLLCNGGGFNAVLITGAGGVGKSYHVEKAFKDEGLVFNKDWFKESGKTSAKAVFLAMLEHYDKIIVFDDCDDALINKNVANLFKAALDTKEHRFVTWSTSDTLDTAGLPNEIIKNLTRNDKKHRMPSTFEFTGAIVFITNLPPSKVEKALLTRCDVVDVNLKTTDIGKIMRANLKNVKVYAPNRAAGTSVDISAGKDELKSEVLDFILSDEYQAHMQKYNMPLNWRLFQKAFTFAVNDPASWKRRMLNIFY